MAPVNELPCSCSHFSLGKVASAPYATGSGPSSWLLETSISMSVSDVHCGGNMPLNLFQLRLRETKLAKRKSSGGSVPSSPKPTSSLRAQPGPQQ